MFSRFVQTSCSARPKHLRRITEPACNDRPKRRRGCFPTRGGPIRRRGHGTSPQRNNGYALTFASACRESITMVARYHRLAISFAQFGHEPALTCRRSMRRLRRRVATSPERFEGSGKFIGEPEMSEAAREFLDRWMSEHVGV